MRWVPLHNDTGGRLKGKEEIKGSLAKPDRAGSGVGAGDG